MARPPEGTIVPAPLASKQSNYPDCQGSDVIGMFNEWFKYREMFFGLVAREIRTRYRGSVLGILWTLINPLLQMIVYTVVFSIFMKNGIPNFSFFVFCALLPWSWFSSSLATGAESIVSNASLVKKVYFPTELLPLVNVTSNMINFIFALPIVFLFMLLDHCPFSWALLALPLVIAIQFVFTAALATILALLNTFYRDVGYILGIVLMVWFYFTPIVYSIEMIPPQYLAVLTFNPMVHLIQAYHGIFLQGAWPTWHGLLCASVVSLLVALCAYPLFSWQKYNFAEVV